MSWFTALLLLPLVLAVQGVLSTTDTLAGVRDLVQRRIPEHVDDFTFKLINGTGDSFIVSDTNVVAAQGGKSGCLERSIDSLLFSILNCPKSVCYTI